MLRRAAAAAAAVLLLALGAPACSPSLTPFGIGTREPEDPAQNFNGLWEGQNSTGREIRFQVGDETVTGLRLAHRVPGCVRTFEITDTTAIIADDAFTLEVFFDQGRLVVNGVFTSASTSAGGYFFEALTAGGACPTAGSGTFTAIKTE